MGIAREFSERIQRKSDKDLLIWMGMARQGFRWDTRYRIDLERGDTSDRRCDSASDLRRLGTCLLHRLSERSREVRRELLEYRRLEKSRGTILRIKAYIKRESFGVLFFVKKISLFLLSAEICSMIMKSLFLLCDISFLW